MSFSVVATGSTSLRLLLPGDAQPSATFQIYRGLTNVFGAASTVGSPQPVGAQVYNDYGLAPGTEYFYWIKNGAAAAEGPVSGVTAQAVVDDDALGESEMDALYNWAYGVYGGLYGVQWQNQPLLQEIKPKIILNARSVQQTGTSDDVRDAGERLAGSRLGMISVTVSTSPEQPKRLTAVINSNLPAGDYTVGINGTAYTVSFASAPASTQAVVDALVAALNAVKDADDWQTFNAWAYGSDPANICLAVEMRDPKAALAVTSMANMTASTYKPPKAMTIAQRLLTTLGIDKYRDALAAASVSPGNPNAAQDVSAILETESELRATFDFPVFLASNAALSGPIIDTVAAPTGTFN